MKRVFAELKNKVKDLLLQDAATKDRSVNFQITVVSFLALAVSCITYCIIQMLR